MTYYKLGCNWGSGKPDFYGMLIKHSIVICAGHQMQKGDFVAITQGHDVRAIAQLTSDRTPSDQHPELKDDFNKFKVDYADWNFIADAEIWELDKSEQFQYKLQQGICKIQNNDIQSRMHSAISIINGRKMINDCIKLLKGNHNLILTGAPGTGKTYMAKQIADTMNGVWKIVQFHPSYDYTDFVEGLRPFETSEKLSFKRKDGVFKSFCKDAINHSFTDPYKAIEQFKKDLANNNIIPIPYANGADKGVLLVKVDENNLFRFHISSNNQHLQAATDEDVVTSIIADSPTENKTYPYFIGNYIKDNYMCNKPFVFIIDEINRGEISKIFGELFYCIDDGYRGKAGRVNTQYQNLVNSDDVFYNGFYVPENVYIIGTMNDIDRSVESMDFAMRRRFAWKEVTAKFRQSMLDEEDAWKDNSKPPQDIVQQMKARMDNLNAAIIDKYDYGTELSIKDKIGLTKAYQIGASYFLKYGLYESNPNPFDDLWENHIEGLLYEYLRGKQNVEEKIKKLHIAYNDTIQH